VGVSARTLLSMGYRPVRFARVTNPFAAPGGYASRADSHGRAGHHTGVDFGKMLVPRLREIKGQAVCSSTPGQVVISDRNDTMGNWVGVYYAPDNVTITYWHMSDRQVRVGMTVARGDVLGHVGSTGNSTAPHLHVQVNKGRGFDYHGHIAPGRWVQGWAWARGQRARRARRS
jgi:murein DD-endopeptidase MepM/ murein hydrolase activator NlpD